MKRLFAVLNQRGGMMIPGNDGFKKSHGPLGYFDNKQEAKEYRDMLIKKYGRIYTVSRGPDHHKRKV